MSDETRSTRRSLLELLLRHKLGLSIEELAAKLSVSRNAVRQHLSSLEREGLIAAGNVRRRVGRPSQLYTLTPLGMEQFPRQYSLLSEMLLSTVRELHGSAGITALMQPIAGRLVDQYAERIEGETASERAESVAALLSELGFDAQSEQEGSSTSISAVNCVYHHLATEFPEICQLDIDLIGRLTGAQVEHTECMVRGGERCRFRLLTDEDKPTSSHKEPESGA